MNSRLSPRGRPKLKLENYVFCGITPCRLVEVADFSEDSAVCILRV